VQWVDSIDEDKLFLSAITIGEIKRGMEKLADSSRKRALAEWLEDDLLLRFTDRILPIDIPVMLVWGQLTADLEKQGRRMPAMDSLIAATCLKGRLDLATRNESDFAHSGVAVVNPWEQ
jgi:tRNA(fMet)-specific endonuclease VapC